MRRGRRGTPLPDEVPTPPRGPVRVRLRNPDRVETVAGPLPWASCSTGSTPAPHGAGDQRRQLVTADHELADDAEVEIRPVISGGGGRAQLCGLPRAAVIEEPRHRAAWCADPLRRPRARPGPQGDRPPTGDAGARADVPLRRPDPGRRVRRQGLAGALGRPARPRLPGRRALRRPRHRRVLAPRQEICEAFAAARGARLHVVDLAETYGFSTVRARRRDATGRPAACAA